MHARFGCAIVGMTIGAAGAVVYCAGEFVESTGYVAPGGCRDTTGAGDAFHGGFLYGFLTGADLETSLQYANAVAAMKCSALGARTALPTEPELKNFLKNPC
jgi:sugar/nucleoside kinase (ribokinase family)